MSSLHLGSSKWSSSKWSSPKWGNPIRAPLAFIYRGYLLQPFFLLLSLFLFLFVSALKAQGQEDVLQSEEGLQQEELLQPGEGLQQEQISQLEEDSIEKGVQLKDLARINGLQTNQLLGYGLVVGLSGSGDSRSQLASESIRNLLGSLGQKTESSSLVTARNIAAVLVSMDVPPFARPGDRLSAIVSSIGDARSLEGGVLVRTPLYAGDEAIYAVAQGVITTGGSTSQKRGSYRRARGKTVGSLLNGAVIEREIPTRPFVGGEGRSEVRISLNHFDFATLSSINEKLKENFPDADVSIEGGSVRVVIPSDVNPVDFIARMEKIRITPQQQARVVINERTGTIVMGGDIQVDPVSVSRGGMEVIIGGKQADANLGIEVSSLGERQGGKLVTQEFSGNSVQEIIQALNALGAGVRDIIAILEALRDSGALHAQLIVN